MSGVVFIPTSAFVLMAVLILVAPIVIIFLVLRAGLPSSAMGDPQRRRSNRVEDGIER